VNFQSAGKINKTDGETQNENAAAAKEKKLGSGMFSKFLAIRNVNGSYVIFSFLHDCFTSLKSHYLTVENL
jgi:hypothetical protein